MIVKKEKKINQRIKGNLCKYLSIINKQKKKLNRIFSVFSQYTDKKKENINNDFLFCIIVYFKNIMCFFFFQL